MPHQLKLYYDSQLKYPVDIFDFGRVEVGESNDLIFYAHNTSKMWPIVDIKADIPSPECKMIELPPKVKPDQTVKCRYKCEPKLDIDDAINFFTKITCRLEIG